MKRVILLILSTMLIALVVFLFLQYRKTADPASAVTDAVPDNASLIFFSQDIGQLWTKVNETNLIWQELLGLEYFKKLHNDLTFLDSLITPDNQEEIYPEPSAFNLSLHHDDAGEPHYLFILEYPVSLSAGEVNSIISRETGGKVSSRKFGEQDIFTAATASGQFNYLVKNNLFAATFSAGLAEEAAEAMLGTSPLSANPGFKSIFSTIGSYVDATLLINFDRFQPVVNHLLNEEGTRLTNFSDRLSGWSALDLTVKPGGIMLNGFTAPGDEEGLLERFRHQKPQEISMVRILPSSTVNFMWYGLSNPVGWLTDHNPGPAATAFTWIEGEAAAIACPASSDQWFHYNIFRARNPMGILETNWFDGITNDSDTGTFLYRDFRIKQLPLPADTISSLFGIWFGYVDKPYTFTLGPYVVMAESEAAARFFIDQHLTERTLNRDEVYNNLATNLPAEANLYAYSAFAGASNTYQDYVSDSVRVLMQENVKLFSHFESAGIQLSNTGDKFYTSFYVHYNPVSKENRSTMWEAMLDAPMIRKPWLVMNHYDKMLEILVQDSVNNLYLYDNKGVLLWKVPLPERILGDVHQVDLFRNGKLQLLFNTRSSIWLIDRNGRNVEPYPVRLPAEATAPLALFDYERNHDYRLLIPAADLKIYNYTLKGSQVEGFKPVMLTDSVNHPPVHMAIAGKDYLIAADIRGKVYVTDRRGEVRLNIRERLPESHSGLNTDKGRDLAGSYLVTTDSSGRLYRLALSDVPEIIKTGVYAEHPGFTTTDINHDGTLEYLYTDTSGLHVYGPAGNQVLKFPVSVNRFTAPQYFRFPDGKARFGFTAPDQGKMWLLDQEGNLFPGFPVTGYSPAAIGDINRDGRMDLVVAGPGNSIFVYNLKD